MNQIWEQIQRAQISPSIPTENEDVSDEDRSSIHHDIEIEDDVDDEAEAEEEEEEEEDEEDDEGECSSSGGDKLNPSSNSDENDKLKNYPCTHCGKVRLFTSYRSKTKNSILFSNRSLLHSII
jgi:hypothetical protein